MVVAGAVVDAELAGSVAVVTGGGSGIGAALSRRLAEAGCDVIIADVAELAGQQVAASIGCDFHLLDVASQADWEATLEQVAASHGGIDVLCLNAGVGTRPRGTSVADDPIPWIQDNYHNVMKVNVDGVVFGTMAAVPHMEAAGHGRVLVTASVAGVRPQPPDPVYGASKAAVVAFVRSIAPALRERNIDINAFCPGSVDTPLMPDDRRRAAKTMSTPEEMAEGMCAVLTSGDSGGVWIASSPDLPVWRYDFAPVMDGPPSE
ncbi:MAG: SDR family NAD(P)-dependent oxidoreductase [Acidimicrobiales bacterium]